MADLIDDGEENIIDEPLSEALSKRYSPMRFSITSRARCARRSKPVQRRICMRCAS